MNYKSENPENKYEHCYSQEIPNISVVSSTAFLPDYSYLPRISHIVSAKPTINRAIVILLRFS